MNAHRQLTHEYETSQRETDEAIYQVVYFADLAKVIEQSERDGHRRVEPFASMCIRARDWLVENGYSNYLKMGLA